MFKSENDYCNECSSGNERADELRGGQLQRHFERMRTGGNLAEVSTRIVETVRERFRLKGRIASLTAQGVLSGWVVGLLPVVLLLGLSLLDPELMGGFFSHPLGMLMLAGGLLMELVGAFFIHKIVNIET